MKLIDNITDKLFRKQWNIGLLRADIGDVIRGKKLQHIHWLPRQKPDRFVADPFVFRSPEGTLLVIYEDFSTGTQYGKISLTAIDQQFRPLMNKEILDTQSHLSYPNVFTQNGKTFIIPEASKGGQVICYEYDFHTHSLINPKIIIKDQPLLDSTILHYKDKYWLFATKRGPDSNNQLFIYHSDRFDGNYHPHNANPVKNELDGSRPAGNFIIENGVVYRPAQNCADYYGKSITINKIVRLNENHFEEEPVIEIKAPHEGGYNFGIHTINVVDDVIVIDALRRIFMPFEQVKIYFKKMFKNKKFIKP